MAGELKATNPAINIEILGVNQSSDYPYNQLVISERKLPWLQDSFSDSAWDRWQVVWRDVRILDSRNRLVAVYNLTSNDLGYATNRATLKQLFLNAARLVDTDGDLLSDDWEILAFGNLSATSGGDPDGDGEDNFSEYAFGTNPNNANSKTSFRPILTGTGPAQYFALNFRRRAGSSLDYIIETSPDLTQWTSSPGTIEVMEPFRNLYDGTGTGQTTCGLTTPVQGQPRGFLRVRGAPRTAQR